MESFVKFDIDNKLGLITIDNPEKKNAFTPKMIKEIINFIDSIEENAEITCILLKSSNDKIFSSGYDISSIKEDYNDNNHPLIQITQRIKESSKIFIAAISGHIFGGALEIAICCDFRFFSKSAIFCIPPARLGIPYSYSGIKNFINCIGISNTRRIFITADKFDSKDAINMGIANFLSESENTINDAIDLCKKISTNAPLSLKLFKKSINSFEKSQIQKQEDFDEIKDLINKIQNSDDFIEGREAFNQKRNPNFKGN